MNPAPHPFQVTRWTMVRGASGNSSEARQALSDLCADYYEPVVAFLRREGRDGDAARELAQDFFAKLLSGSGLAGADPGKGRFRSYLLGALKHHLAEKRRHDGREKRGGEVEIVSLDAPLDDDDSPIQIADVQSAPEDARFDREWAIAVMDRSLRTLESRFAKAGKSAHFDVLKPWLEGNADGSAQQLAASQLGTSLGSVQVMIHRLRKEFRAVVRDEIEHTLPTGDDPDDELRYLIEVLCRPH